MSETPTILEVNAETGEETIRNLTIEEIAEIEELKSAKDIEQEAKTAARISALAKLAELGLTEEEVAAL